MVWKLDRAGRSLPHLIELLKDLQGRGTEFVSITEQIDTTTSAGKLIFHLMLNTPCAEDADERVGIFPRGIC